MHTFLFERGAGEGVSRIDLCPRCRLAVMGRGRDDEGAPLYLGLNRTPEILERLFGDEKEQLDKIISEDKRLESWIQSCPDSWKPPVDS